LKKVGEHYNGGSLLDWLELATFFVRSAAFGLPGASASAHRCHFVLLERISRMTDADADRVEPLMTEFERRLLALARSGTHRHRPQRAMIV
jgi:hypothetical protein